MPRGKMWMPVPDEDLPVGLMASLRVARRNGKEYVVCERRVINIPPLYSAEIAQLKERISFLESQLALTRKAKGRNG